MHYYLDIKVNPGVDITAGALISKVFEQIHFALTKQYKLYGKVYCAVAFPEYNRDKAFPIGKKVRVLADTEEHLEELQLKSTFHLIKEFVHVSKILPVPLYTSFAQYVRFRDVGNVGIYYRAKRIQRRHPDTNEDILKDLEAKREECSKPYICTYSFSTKNKYTVYIDKLPADTLVKGDFNTFGFSKSEATVPDFA